MAFFRSPVLFSGAVRLWLLAAGAFPVLLQAQAPDTTWKPYTSDYLGVQVLVPPFWQVKDTPRGLALLEPKAGELQVFRANISVYVQRDSVQPGPDLLQQEADALISEVLADDSLNRVLSLKDSLFAGTSCPYLEYEVWGMKGTRFPKALRFAQFVVPAPNRVLLLTCVAYDHEFEARRAPFAAMLRQVRWLR